MGPGNKKKAGRFKPGQSGNPSGRPKLTPEEKAVKNLTKEHFRQLTSLLISNEPEELQAMLNRPGLSALSAMVITVVLKAIEDGDDRRMNAILDRVVGKVKEEVDVNYPKPLVIEKLNGDQIIVGTTRDIEGGTDE